MSDHVFSTPFIATTAIAILSLTHSLLHRAMASFSRPLVISGPSGVGKSTLLKRLFAKYPDRFGYSVSREHQPQKLFSISLVLMTSRLHEIDTTRSPRPGELDGKAYHFVERDAFIKLRTENGFIETAEFAGNCYGTSRLAVKTVHDEGRRCILDIEAQVYTSLPWSFMLILPALMHAGHCRVYDKLKTRISMLSTSSFRRQICTRSRAVFLVAVQNDQMPSRNG